MSLDDFAKHLGASRRGVARWSAEPQIRLRWDMQRALDRALAAATTEARQRFRALLAAPGTQGSTAPIAGQPTATRATPEVPQGIPGSPEPASPKGEARQASRESHAVQASRESDTATVVARPKASSENDAAAGKPSVARYPSRATRRRAASPASPAIARAAQKTVPRQEPAAAAIAQAARKTVPRHEPAAMAIARAASKTVPRLVFGRATS